MICAVFLMQLTDSEKKKYIYTKREWEGMGVLLPGLERDGIFPQFFHGIGTGRDFFYGSETGEV